jgi:hypothetical protein
MAGLAVTLTENAPVEQAVDTSITEFDKWFQSLGNDPLVGSERAILKTWLFFALRVVPKETPSTVSSSTERA